LSEHDEQVALFDWAEMVHLPGIELMYAIPNGGHRHPAVAAKLKKEGVKASIPDIHLPIARGGYHGLYIELKKPKDATPAGRATEGQIEMLSALSEEGHLALLCVGWGAAKKTIVDYMAAGKTVVVVP